MLLDGCLPDIKIVLQEKVWVILKNDNVPITCNLIYLPPSLEGESASGWVLRAADDQLVSPNNGLVTSNDVRDCIKNVGAFPLRGFVPVS